jgi:RNA polymerase sigma-70 factor (ECF subfamily)
MSGLRGSALIAALAFAVPFCLCLAQRPCRFRMSQDTSIHEPRAEGDGFSIALAGRLRAGDQAAVHDLHARYRDALVRFCWGYMGNIEEAEDAVQEIFYKVMSTPDVPDFFRPWLYKVARNHCLNALRERAARHDRAALPAASQVYLALTGNLTRLVRDEQQAKLVECVQRLPDTHREVLRLRYVEELSRAEIAEVLELPEPLVKSRIFEGLKKLRAFSTELRER